ncbi:MAG: acetyl-CoA carboxylase biotin carboxyl carrier protein [Vicinamibacteria bacterium]
MDLKELKDLLQILDERQIAEFELEEDGLKLRIRKAGANGTVTTLVAPAVPPPPAVPGVVSATAPSNGATAPLGQPAAPATAAPVEDGLVVVKSPIVGTFYRAPDPNSPPFVNVGDKIKVGQVLCIIEAMKLMNEIEAEVTGEIVTIHPDNGQPIQYGEPLFSVRPGK